MTFIGRVGRKLEHWDNRRHAQRDDALDRNIAGAAHSAKPDQALKEIIQTAWDVGKTIDLSGVGYGPWHDNSGKFLDTPNPYYFFLAGLIRSQGLSRVFEVGTHFGGSCVAMRRGVADQDQAEIVTVDVTDLNPMLHSMPGIKKIVGDANSEAVIKRAVVGMGERGIDLLFIDAAHGFLPTMTNFGLYGVLLRPRFVVFDDIHLNDGMRSLWNVIRMTHGANAINCVDVIAEIRSADCGFGLVRLH